MNIPVFLLGVISMTAQASYLREVLSTFRGGELTIGAALFFWLLWTSAGSGITGRYGKRTTDNERLFHLLLPIYGFLGYAGFCMISATPYIVRLAPGEHASYDVQMLMTATAYLPFNLLGGYLFTVGVRALKASESNSAGRVYTAEALGSAVMGVLFSLVLVAIFSNALIALLCPFIGIAAALSRLPGLKGRTYYVLTGTTLILTVTTFLWHGRATAYYYRGQILLDQEDTMYGRLRVTRQDEQVTFYSDASTLFSYPDPETSEHEVHIPMLISGHPTRILLLGGSFGGVVDEVLKYPSVEHVTCVELDPYLFILSGRYLEEQRRDDTRVETVFADGRSYLMSTGERFDVMVMNMPKPLSGVANRYYTAEFFRLAASGLTEEGILSFALAGAENYIPDDLARFLAGVRKTLNTTFQSVTVLPGVETRFIAAKKSNLTDSLTWENLEKRRIERNVETSYVRDYYLSATMSPFRMDMIKQALDDAEPLPVNSDTRPIGYFGMTLVQGDLENSVLTSFLSRFAQPKLLTIFAGIILLLALIVTGLPGEGRNRRGALIAILSVGMTEISLEVLAIMAYQAVFGYLYGRIALLTGMYMAGLAAGASLSTRLAGKVRSSGKLLTYIQAAIALTALGWCAVLAVRPETVPGKIVLEGIFYVLTALAGIAGGFQFPVADRYYRKAGVITHSSPGAVYGADLAGSSVGALVTASVMIPVMGMVPVLLFLICLNMVVAGMLYVFAVESVS